jgi:hypothetical protein
LPINAAAWKKYFVRRIEIELRNFSAKLLNRGVVKVDLQRRRFCSRNVSAGAAIAAA